MKGVVFLPSAGDTFGKLTDKMITTQAIRGLVFKNKGQCLPSLSRCRLGRPGLLLCILSRPSLNELSGLSVFFNDYSYSGRQSQ